MAILDDLLGHEHVFAQEALTFIDEDKPLVEELLELVFASMSGPYPIEHPAKQSLSRLFTDSCGAVEQSFISTLRAQPRLGWASMRLAAESLKDLDCIIRAPELEAAWFKVLQPDMAAHEAAVAEFRKARRKVPSSEVTRMCSATMKLANILGAHPNASSMAILGVARSQRDGVVVLPLRATQPDLIAWHIRKQLIHGYHVAITLADFRLAYMSGDAKERLLGRRRAFDEHMVPFIRANVRRV